MALSSLQLEAFGAIARAESFSAAAEAIHITQPALSQRILNLESELGTTLIVREPQGLRLTDVGQRLLRYCQSKDILEEEFLGSLKSGGSEISGVLRVAGYSTIMSSVIVPALGKFLREHPGVQLEVMSGELRDLPGMLFSGRAEVVFVNRPIEKSGVENEKVGNEKNVLYQRKGEKSRSEIYLDYDEDDETTFDFFRAQGKRNIKLQRSYLDDIHGIAAGVREGLGRAVMPAHIAQNISGLEEVRGFKPVEVPIYLARYTQSFYSRLQSAAVEVLREQMPRYLNA